MVSAAYQVRRATLDDLDALTALWTTMRFNVTDLRNRLTEFQVALDATGNLVGAVGFQVHQRQGLIHNEAFTDFARADEIRPFLWQRIQMLAQNHGVARLWTREAAPFWTHHGFQKPDAAACQRLPEAWNRQASGWLTYLLRDEEVLTSLEKELALFKEIERQNTAATLEKARRVRQVVTVIGLLAAMALLAAALVLLLTRRGPPVSP
jgi:N-acetylglutamate synthase-like GNAT family acetyltransferase